MRIRPSTVVLYLWVALSGPVARAVGNPEAEPALVLAVGTGAAASMLMMRASRWQLRMLVAIAAGGMLVPAYGEHLALWTAASLLLAPWVALSRPPLPFLAPPGPGVTAPVAVLCGVAAWQGSTPSTTWQPMVPFTVAWLLVVASVGSDRIERFGERVGTLAARAVATVTFGIVGVLLVVVPSAYQRLFVVDPLGSAPGWLGRGRRDVRSGQPWANESVRPQPRPWARRVRVRRAALSCAAVAAVVVVWGPLRGEATPDPALTGKPSPAAGRAWFDEYREDIAWVFDERVALRPLEVYRLLDVRTRHVNIDQGERVTWNPPACDCDRLRIWMYGGSAAFGLEQRDEHTIASELARVAADNGITVDVQNRGMPGQLHWRTAFRFGWDLIVEEPPDLVVFYEGGEEVAAAVQLTERDLGDVRAPYEPYIENLYDEITGGGTPTPPPAVVESLGWPVAPAPDRSGSAGHLAATRYDRSREISQHTAMRNDIPVRYVWQPSRRTDPAASDRFLEASDHLADDVIDLTELFSHRADVSFTDDVHHDEHGARLVAESLFAELEPQLRALVGDGEPT